MRCRPAAHEDHLTQIGTCWLLVPAVQELGYLEITDVDTSLDKVVVKGDADSLSGLGQRYWLIAPTGVDPATGALETDPCKMGSLWLWAGYHYRAPIVGFHNPPGQSAGTYGAQTGNNKLGSYYCWNRIYEPSTGRWTTPDPAASPWTNLSGYCDYRPTHGSDPTGLAPEDAISDENFEADTGVAAAITSGALKEDKAISGKSFVAKDCACGGENGCDVTFKFDKAYAGSWYYRNAKKNYAAGAYAKVSVSLADDCCECDRVSIFQIAQDFSAPDAKAGEALVITPEWGDSELRRGLGGKYPLRVGNGQLGWEGAGQHTKWYVDTNSSSDPMYSFANSKRSSATMWDSPAHWREKDGHLGKGKRFITCAVCEKDGQRGRILACLRWGYHTDSKGNSSFYETPSASCGMPTEVEKALTRWNFAQDQAGKRVTTTEHNIALPGVHIK